MYYKSKLASQRERELRQENCILYVCIYVLPNHCGLESIPLCGADSKVQRVGGVGGQLCAAADAQVLRLCLRFEKTPEPSCDCVG